MLRGSGEVTRGILVDGRPGAIGSVGGAVVVSRAGKASFDLASYEERRVGRGMRRGLESPWGEVRECVMCHMARGGRGELVRAVPISLTTASSPDD